MYIPNFNWIPAMATLNEEQQENLKQMAVKGLQIAGLAAAGYYSIKVASNYLNQRGKRVEQQKLQEHRYEQEKALASLKANSEIRIIQAKSKAEIEIAKAKAEIGMAKNQGVEDTGGYAMIAQKPTSGETISQTLNRAGTEDVACLIGNLVYPGGRIVLFSMTGQGKSTLAMQMGLEIATGAKSTLLPDASPSQRQNVLVYDAENSDDVIQDRYGDAPDFVIPDNLVRIHAQYNSETDLLNDLKARVNGMTDNTTIIIDNISKICPLMTAEPAREFWGELEIIQDKAKKEQGICLTYIIVGHTNKMDCWSPLSLSSLSGSANMGNFATSVIALGPTKLGEGTKLLKVLKSRKYSVSDTVLIMKRVLKPYLHFEYQSEVMESEVLPLKPKAKKAEKKEEEKQPGRPPKGLKTEDFYLLFEEGKTNKEIAELSGLKEETVANKRTKWKMKVANQQG